MTISYPLSLPDVTFIDKMTVIAESIVRGSQSEFNFLTTFSSFQAGRWKLQISLNYLDEDQVGAWMAFLVACKGVGGSFLAPMDMKRLTAKGVASGTPRVSGAHSAGAQSLAIKDFAFSVTGQLKAGDFIQINNYAYMNLKDINSDGSGHATADIFPPLREDLADHVTIITSNVKGIFRLDSNSQNWDLNKTGLYSININAVEYM